MRLREQRRQEVLVGVLFGLIAAAGPLWSAADAFASWCAR